MSAKWQRSPRRGRGCEWGVETPGEFRCSFVMKKMLPNHVESVYLWVTSGSSPWIFLSSAGDRSHGCLLGVGQSGEESLSSSTGWPHIKHGPGSLSSEIMHALQTYVIDRVPAITHDLFSYE